VGGGAPWVCADRAARARLALRKLIGADRIRTRRPGYLLHVSADEVDVACFESLAAQAREQDDPTARSACLRDALALWRGEPLVDLQYRAFARREVARLKELHLAAIEDRVDADLALGRHHELVPELEPLVAEHSFRERLRGQLMIALYRCDRQADALNVFQSGRRALVEELGIDPVHTLQQLELRILRQDPSLDLKSAPAVDVALRSRPPVRYARSGDLSIAYQVSGNGPIDLVLVPGWVSHLEKDWDEPRHARFLDGLGSSTRLIRFDKRGTGLSDRPPGVPDLETRMDDVRTVMDAAGSERAVLFGYSEGAPMAVLFAATYPDRVRGLVLYGAYAKRLDPDDDYPWAPTREARSAYAEQVEAEWGFESDMKKMCPSADEAMARWWGERSRAAASPGAIKALVEMNSLIDVRTLLSTVHVPTLVVHRGSDYDVKVEEGRYIAERIPGARLVELPGADHFVAIEPDQILDTVEPFLREFGVERLPAHEDRALVTLLVVACSKEAGLDREVVRAELSRFRGREIDPSDTGAVALFDGPGRAVRCATTIVRALGAGSRAGVHTGEVEVDGDRVRGVAVQIAAEVAAQAAPGEVLVSQTVSDLVAGSGLAFIDRGGRVLSGVPGELRLLAVADDGLENGLIGRTRELERLEGVLAASASGSGVAVLVSGDAGIGKTRLVSDLATRARARGFEVLVGRCLDLVGTELPYQPFADALRPRVAQLPWVEQPSTGSQLRVFEETLALLGGIASGAPVLLVLEDLHWADTSTLDLAIFLAHNLDGRRALLLATYRPGELASAERVRRLADGVLRSDSALLVELGPLGHDEMAALLAARAETAPSAALAATIIARSDGNPFYAEELLAAAGNDEDALPHALREVLLQRVGRLDRRTRSVLRLAAAAGRDVGYALVCAAAGLPEHEVRESLRSAVEHGLLVPEHATGNYRFRHALLAEAVYETLLPGEREELHARLAEELARGDASAAELARHWEAAGRAPEALAASVEAARGAEAVFGLAEALAHLERAFRVWNAVPDATLLVGLDLAELCSWAAELARWTGEAPRAVELGRRAVELVGDDDPVRAAMLHADLGAYLVATGERDAGLIERERAVELMPPEPSPERAWVLAGFGNALMLVWRHEESRVICEEAVALARAVDAPRAAYFAVAVLGVDLAYLGRGEEGVAQLRQAVRLHEGSGDPLARERVYTLLTDVLTLQGRPRESLRAASEALDLARRHGAEHTTLVANQIEALLAIGEWDEADRASAAALRAVTPTWSHVRHLERAALEIGRGDFDDARSHLETARARVAPALAHGAESYDLLDAELALWERRWADAGEVVRGGLARAHSRDAAHIRVQLAGRACAHRRSSLRAHAPSETTTICAPCSHTQGSCWPRLAAPRRRLPASHRMPQAGAGSRGPSTSGPTE
jgi:pimeloyl-ACP methyl ester carboxylesterase/tetratricopeptide (TPR) repeat protein